MVSIRKRRPIEGREGSKVRTMRSVVAVALMTAMVLSSGCAAMREDRGLCIGVFTATGAVLGATLGGVGVHEWEKNPDDGEIAGGAAGGLVGGGLVGWALSNFFCEEPPPPPPPPPARTPPPPPPPPTERRGG